MTNANAGGAGEGASIVPYHDIGASVPAFGCIVRQISGESQDLAVREYFQMQEQVSKSVAQNISQKSSMENCCMKGLAYNVAWMDVRAKSYNTYLHFKNITIPRCDKDPQHVRMRGFLKIC